MDSIISSKKNFENTPISIVITLSTMFFFWASHGKRFSNLTLNGDSLSVVENQFEWQVGLGRYVQPILWLLRGVLTAPWLYGVLAIIYTIIAIYLLVDVFGITNRFAIIGISGVVVCNKTITYSIAAYIEWMDVYTLALLLSVLGIWLVRRNHKHIPFAAIAIGLGMGLYQGYVTVSIGIVMMLMYIELKDQLDLSKWVKNGLIYCITIFSGAVFYYVLWKIVLFFSGVIALEAGNSSGAIGGYTIQTLLYSVYRTYKNVLIYIRRTPIYYTGYQSIEDYTQLLVALLLVLMLVMAFYISIKDNLKNKRHINILLQAIILFIFPMGINFVCFLSKGMQHDLMKFQFCLIYIFAIIIVATEKSNIKCFAIGRMVTLLAMICVIWMNFVYANQVYLKMALQEETARLVMTRLIDDIEEIDGYEIGVTPVVIAGTFSDLEYFHDIPEYITLQGTGMHRGAITYERSAERYIKYVMGIDMAFGERDAGDLYDTSEMPCWPQKGSIMYTNGVVLVKISDSPVQY